MDYISHSLSQLEKNHLIDLILLRPRVSIDKLDSGFRCGQILLRPLLNLLFTRDQQIATAKGVVIGRFGALQRAAETELMSEIWPQLGVQPVGRIPQPGTLEGGDFIAVSQDIAMLGVGMRTNFLAAHYLMENDLLGTKRFLVVEDKEDQNQQRMHLDTVFSICDEKLCVCLDAIADDLPRFRRVAREYVRKDDGSWERKPPITFAEWLKREHYTVVKVTSAQQERYFLNMLHLGRDTLGRSKILAINPEVEKVIKAHGYTGSVETIDFGPITAMYGGAHCAAQCLRRKPA
jgi:arginine deiminase